jgi:hypothetical protein
VVADLILLVALAASNATPVQASVEVSDDVVHLERDTTVKVRITAPSEVDVSAPDVAGIESLFTIVRTEPPMRMTDDGWTTHAYRLRLRPRLLPNHHVAPVRFGYVDLAYYPPRTGTVATALLPLRTDLPAVAGEADVMDDVALRRVGPPAAVVARAALGILLGLAAFAGIGITVYRVRHPPPLPPPPPHVVALRELDALEAEAKASALPASTVYPRAAEIVRTYLADAAGIPAHERTSREIASAVRADGRFPPAVQAAVHALMRKTDRVKFARAEPRTEETQTALHDARRCVEETDA